LIVVCVWIVVIIVSLSFDGYFCIATIVVIAIAIVANIVAVIKKYKDRHALHPTIFDDDDDDDDDVGAIHHKRTRCCCVLVLVVIVPNVAMIKDVVVVVVVVVVTAATALIATALIRVLFLIIDPSLFSHQSPLISIFDEISMEMELLLFRSPCIGSSER